MAIGVGVDQQPTHLAARRRLALGTFLPAWIGLGLVALAYVVGLSVPISVRYGILLVTLVVLGLPHGAVDHLSVVRSLDTDLTSRFLARFCLGYLALAGGYAVVWFLTPTVAFTLFIFLTWFHWGQGELYSLGTLAGTPSPRRSLAALTIVVRGGLQMLVPLLSFPDRYGAVARTTVSLFTTDPSPWLVPLFAADVRFGLGIVFVAVCVVTVVSRARTSGLGRVWLVDVGETALLWAFFLVVPPVLAIGVYFALWHSLRHITRVMALDEVTMAALDRDGAIQAVGRFVRDALPATAGALVLCGGLALVLPVTPVSVADAGGLYLVLLAVLTLPHVVVVSWLDRRQGVWGG